MTPRTDPWAAVAASEFVSLGTYRRTGELVSSPVWVASEGTQLVVTSERGTGKVKRLRNDPRVLLRPCGRRGAVEPGAATIHARVVSVTEDADDPAASTALGRKYGWQYAAILGFERAVRRLQRRDRRRVIIRISRI